MRRLLHVQILVVEQTAYSVLQVVGVHDIAGRGLRDRLLRGVFPDQHQTACHKIAREYYDLADDDTRKIIGLLGWREIEWPVIQNRNKLNRKGE